MSHDEQMLLAMLASMMGLDINDDDHRNLLVWHYEACHESDHSECVESMKRLTGD